MKYHLKTLGCAKNTVDSWRMESALRASGHIPSFNREDADLLLVNTCGFIDDASEESLNAIRDLDSSRAEDQQLWVAGCLTQIASDRVKREIPGVDNTFGAEEWDSIALALGPSEETYDIPDATMPGAAVSAYLKVSDGCDRPCTFCIIPQIKGAMRSGDEQRLLSEAKMHAYAGAKELVLIAQDTTAFGEDTNNKDGLADFLEKLSEAVPEVPWIRLMYAYPGKVTPKLVETMSELPNVVPYVDMPLQHGSDATLRRMKRPSLRKANQSLELLTKAMPDIALRTTFIVGFPDETESEFLELLEFAKEWKFDHIGAFSYSPQDGTPAFEYEGAVDSAVVADRYSRLMGLAQDISSSRTKNLVGERVDVLIESEEPGENTDGDLFSIGRSFRDAPEVDGMAFVKGVFKPGEIVPAIVKGSLPYDLLCYPA